MHGNRRAAREGNRRSFGLPKSILVIRGSAIGVIARLVSIQGKEQTRVPQTRLYQVSTLEWWVRRGPRGL